jgi:muramoyltetrapeptide carboxypeptidase
MNSSRLPIYTFAPSGRITDTQTIHRGVDYLRGLGFEVLNTECIERAHQRFAGADADRLQEINSLAKLPSLIGPCIALAIRGGYGLSRLLPHIQWDDLAIAVDEGLQIVGHSDITALEIGLFAKTGRKSYAGPMLSYDFGCNELERSEFTTRHFLEITDKKPLNFTDHRDSLFLHSKSFKAEGVLWGGNLSLLNSLIGTSFFPDNSLIRNGILFIEDVNEHPYRVERMLFQLLQAGILGTQQAILFGDFSSYQLNVLDHGFDLQSCIYRIQEELKLIGSSTQIFTDLPFGHCRHKLTLPVGVNCLIKSDSKQFSLQML